MRHQSQEYLKKFLEEHPEVKTILDVGSLDVSGNLREVVHGKEYTGADMRPGNNVDVVVNAHELTTKFKRGSFDLVVCFDTLEHDDAFWESVSQMKKVIKKGGWLMIGVPSRFCPEHDHPSDFWRFMPQMMRGVFFRDFQNVDVKVDMAQDNPAMEDEIYGYGQKP